MPYDEESPRLAFNRVGGGIEAQLGHNSIVAWMRSTNRRELEAVFPLGTALLEIGCGAGADAVAFAERGCRVAALDISDRMIDATRERARERRVEASVIALRGRVSDVAAQLAGLPWAPFDGAYANFSLTYEDSLRSVATVVHSVLKTGSRFLFTLPNRLCFTEPAIAVIRGRPRSIFDRFRDPRWIEIRDVRVRVRAYTVREVRRELGDFFELESYRGLPVFQPSSRWYDPSQERLIRNLARLDDRWDRRLPWRLLGETTLFRARRTDRSVVGPGAETSPATGG